MEVKAATQSLRWRIVHRTLHNIPKAIGAIASFEEFIHNLEPWEVDLLRHTELFADPYTACLELQHETGFIAGSDGSEKFGADGVFGWMISTTGGERVACGKGPSRGHVMDSYRAECSGMLSILRFIIRLAEFTAAATTWEGTIGTDSQSMLDTIFGRDRIFTWEKLVSLLIFYVNLE